MGENSTLIEELLKSVRNSPALRQLIPMEAISGWPIPFKKDGRVYVTIPYYGARTQEKGKTILYPPVAIVTVDFSTKAIVEYINTRYKNPWPEGNWEKPAGTFPHQEISKLTVHSYKEYKRELMHLYETVITCLVEESKLDAEVDRKISEILGIMIEPGLLPFYKAINPQFFGHFLKSTIDN